MRWPRRLSGVLLACAVAGCASGSRPDGSLRCDRCDFAGALGEVVAALAEIDAQVAEARADEGSGSGELWALIDWRRPEADSAVLVVRLATEPSGTVVSFSAIPVARALEMRGAPTPVPGAPGPPIEVCQPCRSWQVAIEASPGDNLRALVNQRDATRQFGEALVRRFAARPAPLPAPPGGQPASR